MMANTMPPIPYNIPMVSNDGVLTPAWREWYRELLTRIGGSIAPTNAELNGSTTAVQTQIGILQEKIDGLNQGPVL